MTVLSGKKWIRSTIPVVSEHRLGEKSDQLDYGAALTPLGQCET